MFNYLSSHCSTALCLQYLVCILLQPAFVRFTGMPTSAGAPAQPANLFRIYPVTIIFPLAFHYPSIISLLAVLVIDRGQMDRLLICDTDD